MHVSHSNGISVFPVRKRKRNNRNKNARENVGPWPKNPWARANGISEKNPFFLSLNLLPLSGAVWWNVDNHSVCPLPCSNYDKKYYRLQYHIPTDSSTDPEEHPYGPEDPQSLPP